MELNIFEIVKIFCQLIERHNAGMVWNPHEIEKFFSVNKLGPAEEDFVNHCIVQWMHHLSAIKKILHLHWKKLTDEKTSQSFMDANVIEALLYLIVFESESFPVEQYEKLLCEFSCYELFKLLQFLSENLSHDGIIFQSLLQIYDSSYIQDRIMEPLMRQRNFLMNLSKNMKPFVREKRKHRRLKKSLTVFKPFNLTKPRPRSIPIPELLNGCPQTAIAIPPTTYLQPEILSRLQEKMIENKRKARKLLEDIRLNHSHYQKSEKSERTLKRMAEILDEQEQQLQFNKWKTIEMPPILKEEACPVRKNIATILREGIYVQKQLQNQLSRIKECESGAFAHFSVHKWLDKINKEELQEQMLKEKALYTKNRLCLEDVKSAKRKSAKAKQQKVEKMQKEKQQLLKELKKEESQKEREIKAVVDKIMASRQQTKSSVRDIAEFKRQQAKEQQANYEEQKTKAEKIFREEQNRRKATIEQIRTLELKMTSERGGDGRQKRRIFSEASAEFMQKLDQVKSWQQEMESARRKEIKEQKRFKKEQLEEIQKIMTDFKSCHHSVKKQKISTENEVPEILPTKVLQENVNLHALRKKTDAAKKKRKQAERGSEKKEQDLKVARQHLKDLVLNSKMPSSDFCFSKN